MYWLNEAILTKKLTKDLINKYKILNGANYFSSGMLQNYLVFVPGNNYFKFVNDTTRIYSWKSIGISGKVLKI